MGKPSHWSAVPLDDFGVLGVSPVQEDLDFFFKDLLRCFFTKEEESSAPSAMVTNAVIKNRFGMNEIIVSV